MLASKPCSQLSRHPDYPNIMCGVDLDSGTTWLAINTLTLDFAMLTNYRCPKKGTAKPYQSRGHLILEFVKINDPTISSEDKLYQTEVQYETKAFGSDNHYRAFNIVWGNANEGVFKYRNKTDDQNQPEDNQSR